MTTMSTADRELYKTDLAKAKSELDTAMNTKDLARAFGHEASLRATLNCGVVPNLLYSPLSMAFDRLVSRMRELGWQQAVPTEQLGLRLVDCATLADLLHVIRLPLCAGKLPLSVGDSHIAYSAIKRLRAALSSLDTDKLSELKSEMSKLHETRDDEQVFDNGQRYFIVYNPKDHNELRLAIAWDYEKDDYHLAARESFDRASLAVEYARDLATRHGKTFIAHGYTHDYLD